MKLLLLLIVALIAGRMQDAYACTGPDHRFTIPRPAAVDVPTNVRAIYASVQYDDPRLIHLRSSDGDEIAIDIIEGVPQFGRIVKLSSELQPRTRYRLFNEPYPGTVEPILFFTTGAGPDHSPPSQPRFEGLHIGYVGESGACGTETIKIDGYVIVPSEADLATVVMRFVRDDGEVIERILPPDESGSLTTGERAWFPGVLGTLIGQLHLELVENESYQVEAWAFDTAGNTSEVIHQRVQVEGGGCAASGHESWTSALFLVFAFRRRRGRRPRCKGTPATRRMPSARVPKPRGLRLRRSISLAPLVS